MTRVQLSEQPTPEGQQSSISCTAPPLEAPPTWLSFDVRDAAAELHDLTGSSLMTSAHERQVRVPVARLDTGIERAGYQVGRLSQNGALLARKQCGDTHDCESACRQ